MAYDRALHLRLSTSCSRFPKKLPAISQKVAQKDKKKFFCCSLPLFGLTQKYANCTTKVRFLSIFVQFCGSDLPSSPETLESVECESSSANLNFFKKNRWPSSPAACISHPWSAPGGRGIWLLFHRKFINCLLKHGEIWKQDNLSTKSCLDFLELVENWKLLRMQKVARNEKSCLKYEKLPKSCRATCGKS